MREDDLPWTRLVAQRAVGRASRDPAEVVRRLGALQAQDYRGSLWGIALRTASATEADVEGALASRSIVRTWPMRGTLHFVAPEDVHWMLRLLAPRVIARSAGRLRELELDAATFRRSDKALQAALAGGAQLTRDEMYAALERSKISTAGQRGIHILGHLAMQGLLCFGATRGKQPTFTLLDEWVRPGPRLEGDEALVQLATRYFTSHGPAMLSDFAWWAGLPVGDARVGIAGATADLREHVIAGRAHWSGAARPARKSTGPIGHLLPPYDEYTVAYRDRSAVLDPAHAARAKNGIFSPVVAIDGRIAGTWRRETKKDRVAVTAHLFAAPSRAERRSLEAAAERYSRFVGRPVTFETT